MCKVLNIFKIVLKSYKKFIKLTVNIGNSASIVLVSHEKSIKKTAEKSN